MIRRLLAALAASRRLRRAKPTAKWACINPDCKGNNPYLTGRCPIGRRTCPLALVGDAGFESDRDAIRGTADIAAIATPPGAHRPEQRRRQDRLIPQES